MNALVLPILYHTVELKVPLQWSRLPSLENLLASSSEGFKYTRCLRIVTKQYCREDDTYCNLDKIPETDDEHDFGDEDESEGEAESDDAEEESEEEDDGLYRAYGPHTSASKALNAFIRVLIVQLPLQQLHTFWYMSPHRSVQLSYTLV